MEFLEGESLRARMIQQGPLSEAETIRLCRQVASGLATAHASQVIHREANVKSMVCISRTY